MVDNKNMIVLKNLSRIYKRKQNAEDVVALNNVFLSLPEKGFVTIVGASGSGKTTLLNIIGGLDKPDSGEMIVDGLSTSTFKTRDWDAYRNEKIGFVFQNCYLLPHLNVRDNIAVKLQISSKKIDDIDKLIDKALLDVDLIDKKYDKPNTLSGGQKQRVAIARAIVGKPTVILADEPTGALDSKNGKQIMELLKKLSKNHLIVMVTHNKDYAATYSDRIIELCDGEIVSDKENVNVAFKKDAQRLKRVSLPIWTSIKWAFKNLFVKKFSTIAIVIASSLGLAGIGIILSISKGVETAFVQTESDSISKSPVRISARGDSQPEQDAQYYIKYTTEQEVFIDLSYYSNRNHVTYMSDRFLNYMNEMPSEYYYLRYDTSVTNFYLYTQVNETKYKQVSSASNYFYKGVTDLSFVSEQYDCLYGKYPTQDDEVVLVVDAYNRINGNTLSNLGFDVDLSHYSHSSIKFEDICAPDGSSGKTYQILGNNKYYYYNDTDPEHPHYASRNLDPKIAYENGDRAIHICGILRERRDNYNPLLATGIMYSPQLLQYIRDTAEESDILKLQREKGLDLNVLTGYPYEDTQISSIKYSKEYLLESNIYQFGGKELITDISYFVHQFSQRTLISNYFNEYFQDKEIDFSALVFRDDLKTVTNEFDGAISLITTVLYVFVAISVLISAILNSILTYVSIHQRTNEIGLLRSMGARSVDIGIMIETESFVTGLVGGLLSIGLALLLINPLNNVITNAIYRYKFYLLSTTTFDLGGFKWWIAPILIGIGIVTSLLSALIPSIIASRKKPARAINE